MAEITKDEKWVQSFFLREHALELRKLTSLRSASTADFEHVVSGKRDFVAELKTLSREPPSVARGWRPHPDGSWERDDNAVDRVATKIHESVRQLQCYHEPRILIFLNQDSGLDKLDLLEAYRGYLVYGNESFSYVNRLSRSRAEGRIRDEKLLIDLYVWVDFLRPVSHFLFPTAAGQQLLNQYFPGVRATLN